MIKTVIIMENTQSRIVNLTDQDLFILREAVVYFDKSGFFRASHWTRKNKPEQFKKYMLDKNGFFPTGIIHRVKTHLESRLIRVEIVDNRIVPEINTESFIMKCSEPEAYLDQSRCTKALLESGQGVASVPTGVGKSRIIKDIIQQTGVRSLVITPSTGLKEQMTQYLEDCFGSKMVGAYDKRHNVKPISIINYHSLGKTDPKEWQDHHLVLTDEFHNSTNNTNFDFSKTHMNSFYFRYGLTGTNFTPSEESVILLEAILSKTVFSMSIREAIEKKYIVPIVPIFFDIQNATLESLADVPAPKQGRKPNATKVFAADYKTFIDNNEERNQKIKDLMEEMLKQSIPTLTLVKHIQHGNDLVSPNSIFLNGQDANAKENQNQVSRFNKLEISQLVGTSVIGEGIDTKACGAVINAKGGKSKKELLQNIGRCVRNFPGKNLGYYFDFIDRGQKNLYSHSRKRMKIIKEEFGIEPKIIKI